MEGDIEDEILKLQLWDKGVLYTITIDLKGLGIKDFDELLSKINIFMHRNYMTPEKSLKE